MDDEKAMEDDTDTQFSFPDDTDSLQNNVSAGNAVEAVDLALAHFSGESRNIADALRDALESEGTPWPAGMKGHPSRYRY